MHIARLSTTAVLALSLGVGPAAAQSVSFAAWRGGARGAYSIIVDDFGGTDLGFRQHADTMLANRGLALTIDIIVGSCTPQNWAYARELHGRGHWIASHSWSHKNPWGPADFAVEIDSSKATIERQVPGNRCFFFGFPYEIFTDTMVNYMRSHGYAGCRAGVFYGLCVNPPGLPDPFRCQFKFYGTPDSLTGLNNYVNDAITRGGWSLRETHHIAYNEGYNPVPPDIFAAHLDFCRNKIDSGQLWMAPVETVLRYALERSRWSVAVTGSDSRTMSVAFNTSAVINASIDNRAFDVPLTLQATLPGGWSAGTVEVTQGAQTLPHMVIGANAIRFDADPWGGVVTIHSSTTATTTQPPRVMQPDARRMPGAGVPVFGLDGRLLAAEGPWTIVLRARDDMPSALTVVRTGR